MNSRKAQLGLLFLLAGAAPGLSQTAYYWDGSQNNNWDNGPNWEEAPGWPNHSTHNAFFDHLYYNENHADVDLRGGTFDIGNLNLNRAVDDLLFRSSVATPGTLRVHGNVLFAKDFLGFVVDEHTFDINLVFPGTSEWRAGDDAHIEISGQIQGGGNITTAVAQNPAKGKVIARLLRDNSFSGHFTINDGRIDIRDPKALQNAHVTVNWDDGFYLYNLSGEAVPIGPLDGTKHVNIRRNHLTSTSGINTTLSGSFQGYNPGSSFTKAGSGDMTLSGTVTNVPEITNSGTGTLKFTGDISGVEILRNDGGGSLLLQDNTATLDEIVASIGSLYVGIGADVSLNGTGIARSGGDGELIVSGSGAILHSGAELAATTGTGEGYVSIGNSGRVEDFDIVTAGQLGTGFLTVSSNGELFASALGLGGKDEVINGGTGFVTVSSSGRIEIEGQTSLWTDTGALLVINDGTMSTGTLTNPPGSAPTVFIEDPSGGGAALTIGSDTVMPQSTFSGTIQNGGGGTGSVEIIGVNEIVFSGANTYSGGTTVKNGKLLAENSSGSATGAGGVTINNGGTFGGNGSADGLCLVRTGGILTPGTSTGHLSVEDVTFREGSKLIIELADTNDFDQLEVTGAAILDGTLDLTYIDPFTASPGSAFVILSAGSLSGTFDAVNFPDVQTWFIDYDDGLGTVTVGPCLDDDSDGVCNFDDVCPGFDDQVDADSDGVPDGCDICPGFDDTIDDDTDGVPNGCDVCQGDDASGDSDSDGVCDNLDGCPNDANKTDPGVCGCGVPETDSDSDGTPDCIDGCPNDSNKTDPGQCGCGVADNDSDNDGTADCNDGCPNDSSKTDPGQCGCGVADDDSDNDGTADCNDGCPNDSNKTDPGICGCGVPDTDSDNDGTPDCNDGCPNDMNKTDPGVCGCGVSDVDTDSDGTPDCNDGCPNDSTKTDPGTCGCGVADTDGDSDTVPACLDCDDNDPDVFPGNTELTCDGVDNDCDPLSEDNPDSICDVSAPLLIAEGSRYVEVTPQGGDAPVALRITSDDAGCLSKYIDFDGNAALAAQGVAMLVDTPVYRTPSEWGTLHVRGLEIVPGYGYTVHAEVAGHGVVASSTADIAYLHGDVDDSGVANFADISSIVDAFKDQWAGSRGAVDLVPCVPDWVVNFADIDRAVAAFKDQAFETFCALPCSGGVAAIDGGYTSSIVTLELRTDQAEVRAGETVWVEVWVTGARALRTYQLALESVDNKRTVATPIDAWIQDDTADFALAGREVIEAANLSRGQIGAASLNGAAYIGETEAVYLATFAFQATEAGALTIRADGQGTLMIDDRGRSLPITINQDVTVPVFEPTSRKRFGYENARGLRSRS